MKINVNDVLTVQGAKYEVRAIVYIGKTSARGDDPTSVLAFSALDEDGLDVEDSDTLRAIESAIEDYCAGW